MDIQIGTIGGTGRTRLAGRFANAVRATRVRSASDRSHNGNGNGRVVGDSAEAALRIAERVRSSLDLDEVLALAVEELGRAAAASRCRLRVAREPEDFAGPLYHWQRPGLAPLDFVAAPALAARVLTTGKPTVVEDAGAVDEELRGYLAVFGAVSFLGYPILWHGRTVAVLGLFDDRPREWTRETLPLLERVLPQIAAAIAQADLFRRQQQAVERLEELARLREHLVANVSHELRTPLTSTIGFLRTLERPDIELTPERRAQLLAIAREQAERLGRLVEDLLELSSLEHGTPALAPRTTCAAAAVRAAAAQAGVAPERRLRLDVPEALTAWVDPDRLLQVLSNLISNALLHGAGDIRVSGESGGSHITLTVGDDGAGVPDEHVSELFAPFGRWSHGAGTGLGLAVARAIAEAEHGTLVYRRRNGTRRHAFVVTLPAARPDLRGAAVPPLARPVPTGI